MFAFGFPRAWDTAYDHVGAVLHWRLLRAELQVRAEPGFSGHQRGHHPVDSLVLLQPWATPWPGTCHCDSRKEYHWTLLQIIDLCRLPQSSRVSTLYRAGNWGSERLKNLCSLPRVEPAFLTLPRSSVLHTGDYFQWDFKNTVAFSASAAAMRRWKSLSGSGATKKKQALS